MARGHATDVTIRHHARLTSKGVVIRFFTLAPLHANRRRQPRMRAPATVQKHPFME